MARSVLGLLSVVTLLTACGSTQITPQARSVVILSGERIPPDSDRMAEVERWLRPQLEEIERNPTFLISLRRQNTPVYPWDSLEIQGDTARIYLQDTAVDSETAFLLYAHFRFLEVRGEEAILPWLPEAESQTGYQVERAILRRIADVWLFGRSVFDTQAHEPLEELLYSAENGFLDDFLVATQGERFPEDASRWRAENPEREAAFRAWFRQAFEREGPGFVRRTAADSASATEG